MLKIPKMMNFKVLVSSPCSEKEKGVQKNKQNIKLNNG
jgi:hypothetical protein